MLCCSRKNPFCCALFNGLGLQNKLPKIMGGTQLEAVLLLVGPFTKLSRLLSNPKLIYPLRFGVNVPHARFGSLC